MEIFKQKFSFSMLWKIVAFVFLLGGAYASIRMGLFNHEKRITKIEEVQDEHKIQLARIDEQYKNIKEGIESINKKLD